MSRLYLGYISAISRLYLACNPRAQLPERFFRLAAEDFPQCDLLIVTGTSLKVQPFASLVGRVGSDVPRLLVNRERVGETEPI